MIGIHYLSQNLAVAGALSPADFAALADCGFRTVINNRPDGEEEGQLASRDAACLAGRAGLAYHHIPAAKHEVLDDHALAPLAAGLAGVMRPVLMHCRSGLRSAIMWAAISVAAGEPLDLVLAAAKEAGFDIEGVREELAERAVMQPPVSDRLAPRRAAA
jgi:uncharacterized protein (TIGR01244 family)